MKRPFTEDVRCLMITNNPNTDYQFDKDCPNASKFAKELKNINESNIMYAKKPRKSYESLSHEDSFDMDVEYSVHVANEFV